MCRMFGPKLSTIFASRWRALWFAGSTLLLAYCSIPSAEETEADLAVKQAQHHKENPWALERSR